MTTVEIVLTIVTIVCFVISFSTWRCLFAAIHIQSRQCYPYHSTESISFNKTLTEQIFQEVVAKICSSTFSLFVIWQNRCSMLVHATFTYDEPRLKMSNSGCTLIQYFQPWVHHIWMSHSLPCIICAFINAAGAQQQNVHTIQMQYHNDGYNNKSKSSHSSV